MENSKEALHKAYGTSTNKNNDLREALDGSKSKEKRRGEDKQAKRPKKQRNKLVDNKGPLPKYMNYHSLNAPLDHIVQW